VRRPCAWTHDPAPDDVRPVIDEELARLPEKYRAPVLLCDLEGQSIDEAASLLAWPRGTVGTRLAKARAILKSRLVRRGLGFGTGLVVLHSSASPVSASWINQTTRIASIYATDGTAAAGTTPAAVLASQILLETAMMTKMRLIVALTGALLLVGHSRCLWP
jgi:Sigma-70, region 4